MTPEERKAIAMRQGEKQEWASLCERRYPKCCSYHEGFDDALGMLEQVGEGRCPLYTIEPPEKAEA